MRAYELMVIISGKLDESAAHAWIKTISASVAGVGGQIHGNPDWWGKRRFAYPINKKEDGYYVVYNLEALGGALDEVERTLRIADEVVRHKLMRLPDHEAARRGMMSASA
jgi:small subunit ribosomal protein S6